MTSGPMAQHVQASLPQVTKAVFDAYRSGVFGQLEVTRYPLTQAAAAHDDIASRRKFGTQILIP